MNLLKSKMSLVVFGAVLSLAGSPAMASDKEQLAQATTSIKRGDIAAATRLLTPLAERNNAAAQEQLWSILKTTDEKQAMQWLKRATDNGNLPATFNLAMMHLHGNGVPEDVQLAFKYLKKAANGGIPEAQLQLGLLYRNGPNALQDDTESARWLRRAADKGYADAQYNLAESYRYGYGVKVDAVERKKWLQRAAKQGHAQSIKALSELG